MLETLELFLCGGMHNTDMEVVTKNRTEILYNISQVIFSGISMPLKMINFLMPRGI